MGNLCQPAQALADVGGEDSGVVARQARELEEVRCELALVTGRLRAIEGPELKGREATYAAAHKAIVIRCNNTMKHVIEAVNRATAEGHFTTTVELTDFSDRNLNHREVRYWFNRADEPELAQLLMNALMAAYGPKCELKSHDIHKDEIIKIFVDLRP